MFKVNAFYSWQTVRFYDVSTNEQKAKFDHRAAVLACTFGNATQAFTGGLDNGVREYATLDLSTERVSYMGQHGNSVSAMNYSRDQNMLVTGSWDLSLKFWDPRAAPTEIAAHTLPERVYHMDLVNTTLVVAMASRLFHIYDIRKLSEPAQTRESSLKFMTRSLACMIDGKGKIQQIATPVHHASSRKKLNMHILGYAIGSVEGRIGVEYFDPAPEVQDQKYAFKCHRQTIDDVDHVWPVNSLAFHPVHNTFASAGSDGTVSIWDHKVKKRLRQYPKYSGPIPSVAFNCDGSRLAVGVSYTWDDGEEGAKTAERPAIWVRKTGDEVKVRYLAVFS
ncbi:hypothetical protein ID866_4396, partial [Astraeus odoratus]